MKKLISLALSMIMLLSLTTGLDFSAYAVNGSGKCGENVTYTFDSSSGALVISGSGAMSNYYFTGSTSDQSPFFQQADIKKVIIDEGVTSIGSAAFYCCKNLTSVMIPDSVTSIGTSAFEGCSNLAIISIPDSVTDINQRALYGTSYYKDENNWENNVLYIGNHLIEVNESISGAYSIREGTKTIAAFAFDKCTYLTNITIPDTVISICSPVFSACTSLISIKICVDNTVYDSRDNCNAIIETATNTLVAGCKTTAIPDSVTDIGDYAFYKCTGLTSLTMPNNLTSIGINAFYNCTSLTSLTIPDSLISIGNSAFNTCTNLKELTIPCSTKIYNSEYTFKNCTNIENIIVTKGTGNMQNYGTSTLSTATTTYYKYTPWYISRSSIKELMLEDGINNIGKYAFCDCTGLTHIKIPDSVTNIGASSFAGCSNLTSIMIPDSVINVGASSFADCSDLTNITIPDNVTNIDNYAFRNCSSITSITIPDSIATISNSAFYGCTGLTSVTFPDSVTNIGNSAFYGCTGLTSVTFPDSVTTIGDSAFFGCKELISIAIPDSVTSIGDYAFAYCEYLTSVMLPNNISSISNNAFCRCEHLIGISIPDSVTSIGDYAFADCSSLTNITIPDSVTSLGNDTFNGCSSLTSITIPETVINLGFGLFENCKGLEQVTLPDNLTELPLGMFSGCNGIKELTMPSSAKIVFDSTFSNCTNIEKVTLTKGSGEMQNFGTSEEVLAPLTNYKYTPWYISRENFKELIIEYGVTKIGDYAFYGCKNLMGVTMPDTITSVGEFAFTDTAFYNNGFVSELEGLYSGTTLVKVDSNISGVYHVKEGTKTIAAGAFSNCTQLTEIIVPDSVVSIGNKAFSGCTNLISITIPESVTKIGDKVFSGCNKVEYANIPCNALSVIAPFKNSLKELVLTTNETSSRIEASDISGCKNLNILTLPISLTYIDDGAFEGCSNLKELYVPASLNISQPVLGYYSSSGANLERVTFTKGTGTMSGGACSLLDIGGNVKEIVIEEGVTNICGGAFWDCDALTRVTIPDSVTSIGDYAFSGCTSLTSVTIPDGVKSLGKHAFAGCAGLKELSVPCSISKKSYFTNECFNGCNNIEKIVLTKGTGKMPEYYTNIYDAEYEENLLWYICKDSLKELIIEDGVTSICSGAFSGCTNLATISLPDSLSHIGKDSFSYTAYYNDRDNWDNGVLYIGNHLIKANVYNNNTYIVKQGTKTVADYAFRNNRNLTSVAFPDSLSNIGYFAFEGCNNLNNVNINNLETWCALNIADTNSAPSHYINECDSDPDFGLFSLSYDLHINGELVSNIELPEGLTTIKSCNFSNCKSINSISIPKTITMIEARAFASCPNLNTIILQNGVTNIGDEAFSGCTGLTSIIIPESVKSIGKYAFKDCDSLTDIVVPDGVTSIGNYAFSSCDSLKSITIPISVNSIGRSAFAESPKLKDIYYYGREDDWSKYSISLGLDVIIHFNYSSANEHTGLIGKYSNGIKYSFDSSTGTLTISGKGAMPNYSTPDVMLFEGDPPHCTESPWYSSRNLVKHIIVEDGITKIGSCVFYGCSSLESVSIPASVTDIGDYAFYNCKTLKRVNIANVESWCNITFGSSSNPLSYAHTLYLGGEPLAELIIPAGVTKIKSETFSGCESLVSLTINEGVTRIDDDAFNGCKGLTEVILPESATSLGWNVFENCSNLKTVHLPESLNNIPFGTFSNCSKLEYANIPKAVTKVGDYAFQNCASLKRIRLPEGVTAIGEEAFYGCRGLTEFYAPKSITSVGKNAFSYTSNIQYAEAPCIVLNQISFEKIKEIKISSNEKSTKINSSLFGGCSTLESVTIEDSVTEIGDCAFSGCANLKSIYLPKSITAIGNQMLTGCSSLESIIVDSENTAYDSRSNCNAIINSPTNELIAGCKNTTIPESVTKIGEFAFSECSGLKSVYVPKNITSIGEGAYHLCSGIESISVNRENTVYDSRDNCNAIIETSTNKLILGCKNTTIPKTVTEISDDAFEGDNSIRTLCLDNRTDIINTVLNNVRSIDTLVIGNNYTADTEELTDLLNGISVNSISVEKGNTVYDSRNDCNAIIETSTNTLILGSANTVIPSTVTSIGNNAFESCRELNEIVIPDSVTDIGMYAFCECENLSNVTLPKSLKTIKNGTFEGCQSLTQIVIPNTVESIGERAFSDCIVLSSITIPDSVKTIDQGAFLRCIGLTDINFGNGLETIGNHAFQQCTSLKRLVLPNSIKTVKSYAFFNCEKLTEVVVPSSLNSIGTYAFGYVGYGDNDEFKRWISGFHFASSCNDISTVAQNYASENYVIIHQPIADKFIPATCTSDGKTEGSHCSACGKVLTEQKAIKATGHTIVTDKAVPATFKKSGKTAGKHCKVCGAIITAQQSVAKLSAAKLSKVKAGKKNFTATWKAVNGVDGYEVQYSRKKNMKKAKKKTVKGAAKTKLTVKKLKAKKTYYVRIRAYKVINGKKIYSSWSAKKKVTTKK